MQRCCLLRRNRQRKHGEREMSKPDWMSSLVGNLARDETGKVIGVEWRILTLHEHLERLPDSLQEAATAMLTHGTQRS